MSNVTVGTAALRRPRRNSRRSSRWSSRRRTWAWVLGTALLALLLIAGWVGVRGFLAYQALDSARSSVASVAEQVRADPAAAAEALRAIGTDTQRAAQLTADPVWRVAEAAPWIGPNLAAFRITADSLDTVVREVGVGLVEPAAQFEDALRPVEGRIDPAPLVALQPLAADAVVRLDEVDAAMASIDTTALLGPLSNAVDDFIEQLAPVSAGVRGVHGATVLVPALLGADGPRETLLLFLNNAELRSTVGIPGALALVRTDQGTIDLAQQASTRDFPRFETPVMQLSPEIRGIYGDRPALWMQNVTYVPQFALSGELAATMWELQFGSRPQAVLALDPFTLAGVLQATGPITLSTGEVLSSDNAVDFLLHGVYLQYPEPAEQDLVFADAAARVFGAVASGSFEPVALINALGTATAENRVKLWSSVAAEQEVIEGTLLAGELPESADDEARFAMLLNDSTGSKMDYYLASTVELVSGGCPVSNANQTVKLRVTLTNTAPADAASTLPDYITGGGWFVDAPPGEILTTAQVFAPPGFELQHLSVDGATKNVGSSESAFGRSMATWNPRLAPGQISTLELEYVAADHPGAVVSWQQTPTFQHSNAEFAGPLC